jgi:uncharacterized protein (DUF924 family)
MASQDRAVFLAAHEIERGPEAAVQMLRMGLDQAIRHRDVIQWFGRFPHAVRGRLSTLEELAFMATALRGRGF